MGVEVEWDQEPSEWTITSTHSPARIAKPGGSLFVLVASDELAQILARVAVVAAADSSIDVLTHRLRQSEAHRVAAHVASLPLSINSCQPLRMFSSQRENPLLIGTTGGAFSA